MFRANTQVGPYLLIEKLGQGGFGEVWLAEKRSELVVKKVAVKLPHPEQVDIEAIRQEATLWEKASGHPNVLPIIDADIYDGQVVIVSEYASGGSLAEKLKSVRLPVEKTIEIVNGILCGLEFLHSREIIHRDIKPQNILLQNEVPRLADFGISRAMNVDTISSVVVGTDSYMAPEAFDGVRNIQTDIWSVGVVLYEMLKGSRPFPQKHPTERMFAILTKDFEPLPETISPVVREIVSTAMAKQPSVRFINAVEMSKKLKIARNQFEDVTPLVIGHQEISEEIETRIKPRKEITKKEISIAPVTEVETVVRKRTESPVARTPAEIQNLPARSKVGLTQAWLVFEDEGATIVFNLFLNGMERVYCNGILKAKKLNLKLSNELAFDFENRQYRILVLARGLLPECSLYRQDELLKTYTLKINWLIYLLVFIILLIFGFLAGFLELSTGMLIIIGTVMFSAVWLILWASIKIVED